MNEKIKNLFDQILVEAKTSPMHRDGLVIYELAYNELEAQNKLVKFDMPDPQTIIDDFINKVNGPCLIPKEKLESILEEKKKRGVIRYSFEFFQFARMIDEYYGIQYRNFFHKCRFDIMANSKMLINFLGCSKEEFNAACHASPFKSVLAAKLRLISEINKDEEWAYFDLWHKHIDGDFCEVTNGSTVSLYFNEATSEHITKHDTDELVAAYTSIFFKEAAQFDFFNNEEIDSIEFEISW
jgi:hypothetical protein